MSTWAALVGGAMGIAVAAAPAIAQNNGRDAMTWNWDGAVPSGAWMRVYDINGPITVERSSDGRVHVRAEKQVHSGGDPSVVHFAVARDGNDVAVCALWRDEATCDADGEHDNEINMSRGDRRQNVVVAFTVEIPDGVRTGAHTVNGELRIDRVAGEVNAHTVNGTVAVRGTGGPVMAHTVNGDVVVDTRGGPVSAHTVNGSIRATMGQQGTTGMHFQSVNGSIEIATPSRLDATVDLGTVNGSISSKYPLEYDRRRRHAEGTVGQGGRELTARTVNGSITLN